ncbi:hypothetical protein EPO17_02095 [Patescibacteria group bacterium]|nr:MAG: hypothetical protein EPO17_02095 [Patescibacteria group bacterium]
MKKMNKNLVLSAILAVVVIGFTGCAHQIKVVTDKLPGKEHKPNKAMAGVGREIGRQPLYYPEYPTTP